MANSSTKESDSEDTLNEILEEVYDDEIVKVAVCGDEQIGKSMLLLSARPANGMVPSPFKAVMVDKTIHIDNGKMDTVRIELCDTGSTPDYQALRAKAFKNADIILCCFDISNETSLAHIEQIWLPEIQQFSAVRPILLLVGLKSDLRATVAADADTLIAEADIERFTAQNGDAFSEYMEVSALKKHNVESIFERGIHAFRSKGRRHRKSTVMPPDEDPNDLVGTHQRQWQAHLKETQSEQQVFAQFTNKEHKQRKKRKKSTRRKDTGATDQTDRTEEEEDDDDGDDESGSESDSGSGSDSNVDKHHPNYNKDNNNNNQHPNPVQQYGYAPMTQMQYTTSDPYNYNPQVQAQMYASSYSNAQPTPAFFQPPNLQQMMFMSHSARSLASNGSHHEAAAAKATPPRPASASYAFHGGAASQHSFQFRPPQPQRAYGHVSSRSSGAPLQLSQNNFSMPMRPTSIDSRGSGSSQHLYMHASQNSQHGPIPIMNAAGQQQQHFAQQRSHGSQLRLTNAYTLPMQPQSYIPMGGSSRTLPDIQQQMQMGGSARNLAMAYSTSVDTRQQQHLQQQHLQHPQQRVPSGSSLAVQQNYNNGHQSTRSMPSNLGQMVNSMQLHQMNNNIPPPPPATKANEDVHAGENTIALKKVDRKLSVSRDRNESIDYLDSGDHHDDDADNRGSCRCKCVIL